MNSLSRTRLSPSSESPRNHLKVVEGGVGRNADWALAGLVIASALFAGALAKYVLYPAISALVG